MASFDRKPAPFQKETTFSSYNQEQGKTYAAVRRNYDPGVYQAISDYHVATGGAFDRLLDVGCGPGIATLTLAPRFTHAVGIDPSDGMLATARLAGGVTSSSEPVRFERSSAEELGSNLHPPIADSSVDMITAATAAHWFDMTGFWPSAARVLKPGGTVAIWGGGPLALDPTIPNADAIDKAVEDFRTNDLAPYRTPGNDISHNRYRDLLLPWTLETPVADFAPSDFVRREWQPGEVFHSGPREIDLDTFEKMISTGSGVTRWRQDHPDLVGTEQDVIRRLRRTIEKLLHEAGVEEGQERLRGDSLGVLLLFKKKAS